MSRRKATAGNDWKLLGPFIIDHPRLCAKLTIRRCGARCKSTGKPCMGRAMPNGRCRYHGGMSTGPLTAKGRERALMNLKQFR